MNKKFKRLLSLFCVLAILTSCIVTANAAGSASFNLASPGEYRLFTEWQSNSTAEIDRKSYIYVYAFAGETIHFGGSVYDSYLDINGQKTAAVTGSDIVMLDPLGNKTAFDVDASTGKGYIKNYTMETAGPNITGNNKNGYTPFSYTASKSGIYEFHFHSQKAGATNPAAALVENPFTAQQDSTIAAWDITVTDSSNTIKTGRAYTYYLALNTGANFNGSNALRSNASMYVLTDDSYIYEVDFNGISPWGFIFFANSRGLCSTGIDSAPLYHSVGMGVNDMSTVNQICNVDYRKPGSTDTLLDKSFKLFFEKPGEDLLNYLFSEPEEPAEVTDLQFHGVVDANTTYRGQGGYFTFNVTSGSSVTLALDFSNGTNPNNPSSTVTLSNAVVTGENTFYWDGNYDDGTPVPIGLYNLKQIKVSTATKSGEIHFPMLDVEGMNDITVTRLNGKTKGVDTSLIYFNNLPLTNNVINEMQTPVYTGISHSGNKIYKLADGTSTIGTYTGVVPNSAVNGIPSGNDDTLKLTYAPTTSLTSGGNMAIIDLWSYYKGDEITHTLKNQTSIKIIEAPDNVATMQGVVFFDADNDGGSYTSAKGDYGLAKVKIDLLNTQGEIVQTVTSDYDGNYRFYNVAYGSYTVSPQVNSGIYTNTTKNHPQAVTFNASTQPKDIGYYHDTSSKDIVVHKQWKDGLATEKSVKMQLYAVYRDTMGVTHSLPSRSVVLSAINNWCAAFQNLPGKIDGYPTSFYMEEYYTLNGKDVLIGTSQIIGDEENYIKSDSVTADGTTYSATFEWSYLSSTEYQVKITNAPPSDYKVTFHSNIEGVSDIFRVYTPSDTSFYEHTNVLAADKSIPEFTETPLLNEQTQYNNNRYIFAGWYYFDGTPLKWDSDKYFRSTDVYAHWVEIEAVNKDPLDTKITGSQTYSGFDLFGLQIRADKYEKPGLRFVTSYSNSLIHSLDGLFTKAYTSAKKTYNHKGPEYGYATAKTQTIKDHLTANQIDPATYKVQLGDYGVLNGVCTKTLVGTDVDHRNFNDYRISSMVITYSNDPDGVKKAADVLGRSYIQYTDANGIFRTAYNDYTGTSIYNGCSASYNTVLAAVRENPDHNVTD